MPFGVVVFVLLAERGRRGRLNDNELGRRRDHRRRERLPNGLLAGKRKRGGRGKGEGKGTHKLF